MKVVEETDMYVVIVVVFLDAIASLCFFIRIMIFVLHDDRRNAVYCASQ